MGSTATRAATGKRVGPYRLIELYDPERLCYRAENVRSGGQALVWNLAVPESIRADLIGAIRRLGHSKNDHIVPIVEVGETDDGCFVATRLLEGESLQARLMREHRLPLKTALRIARELAAGLSATHAQGLIHHDICPANVWLEPNGRVRLMGFSVDDAPPISLLDRLEQPRTTGYPSPERAIGEPISSATDVFDLGCVLYQMLTGESPFPIGKSSSRIRSVVFDEPRPARESNPEVGDELESALARLLAKLPSDRPSAVAVEQRLQQLLAPTGSAALTPSKMPAPAVYPASRRILEALPQTMNVGATAVPSVAKVDVVAAPPTPSKRSWLPDLVAGLLLVIAGLGLYLWWKASNQPAPAPAAVKLAPAKQ